MFHNLRQLVRYRALIQSLVTRELKARYRGSVLGFFWSFINPLLLLVVYSFVFTVVLPGTIRRDQPYALFMFCGILPWTWFSSSLTEAANSLMSGGNLIKKVLFPAEILPIVHVLSNMMHFFFGLPILLASWCGSRPTTHRRGVVVPRGCRRAAAVHARPRLLLAALTVHFRDIKDILSNLLTLWFFATPIIYPMHLAPGTISKTVLNANPFSHFAVSYQEILFYSGPSDIGAGCSAVAAGSVLLFLLGYWLFDRLRDSFAEEV